MNQRDQRQATNNNTKQISVNPSIHLIGIGTHVNLRVHVFSEEITCGTQAEVIATIPTLRL